MKILLIAPQPFFTERGTPIAIDMMLESLSRRGDDVDVVTFHLGEDRHYPGVRLTRIAPWRAPAYVKPGFSPAKLYCDAFLAARAALMLRRERYDLIYGIEEGGMIAMLLGAAFRLPFVYDMDSLMTAQLLDRFPALRPLTAMLRYAESLPMRRAEAVVPMCEDLARHARRYCSRRVFVLKDVSLIGRGDAAVQADDLRRSCGIEGSLLLYVGNLEAHQGIDLLLRSFAEVQGDADLVIIGGSETSVAKTAAEARALGVDSRTHLLGPRPVAALDRYLAQADLLISPRTEGSNTPLKLYSYLGSGVPVVATDMPTHTQVVSGDEAALAAPEPGAMAATIDRLLAAPAERRRLRVNARDLVLREHSPEAFHEQVVALFEALESDLGIDPARSSHARSRRRRARLPHRSHEPARQTR